MNELSTLQDVALRPGLRPETIHRILRKLEQWLKQQDFKGWEPHDASLSPALSAITKQSHMLGLIALQLLKRSPFNLRPLLGIKPEHNAKAMGLFLESYTRLAAATQSQRDLEQAKLFAHWLAENALTGYSGACWGYHFDWANRRFFAPRFTPNLVVTVFVAFALLEYYRSTGETRWLHLVESACEFISNDLNRTPSGNTFCFSYTPLDHSTIHNANMLGAALLAQTAAASGNHDWMTLAERAMQFSLQHQQKDGSWFYGEQWYDRWIDSYHTGYSLVALKQFIAARGDRMGVAELEAGLRFYLEHFFDDHGNVKYYHNKKFPLESHAFAQALVTLQEFSEQIANAAEITERVFDRSLQLFWHPKGYFFFRRNRLHTVRIPFTRWVQAWMFLALTRLYQHVNLA